MQSCCQKEHSNLNSLWYRSVIMSGIGLLMMVPLVESMILHASFTLPAMGALFSYMLWVLYSDFSKEMGRFIATLFAISGIILSPVYLSWSLQFSRFSLSLWPLRINISLPLAFSDFNRSSDCLLITYRPARLSGSG